MSEDCLLCRLKHIKTISLEQGRADEAALELLKELEEIIETLRGIDAVYREIMNTQAALHKGNPHKAKDSIDKAVDYFG